MRGWFILLLLLLQLLDNSSGFIVEIMYRNTCYSLVYMPFHLHVIDFNCTYYCNHEEKGWIVVKKQYSLPGKSRRSSGSFADVSDIVDTFFFLFLFYDWFSFLRQSTNSWNLCYPLIPPGWFEYLCCYCKILVVIASINGDKLFFDMKVFGFKT